MFNILLVVIELISLIFGWFSAPFIDNKIFDINPYVSGGFSSLTLIVIVILINKLRYE